MRIRRGGHSELKAIDEPALPVGPRSARRMAAVLLLMGFAFSPPLADSAGATDYRLEWTHESPAHVARFKVYVTANKDRWSEDDGVEVGRPGGPSVYRFDFDVEAGEERWVAVRALGTRGQRSPLSEWRRYVGREPLGEAGRPHLSDDLADSPAPGDVDAD